MKKLYCLLLIVLMVVSANLGCSQRRGSYGGVSGLQPTGVRDVDDVQDDRVNKDLLEKEEQQEQNSGPAK